MAKRLSAEQEQELGFRLGVGLYHIEQIIGNGSNALQRGVEKGFDREVLEYLEGTAARLVNSGLRLKELVEEAQGIHPIDGDRRYKKQTIKEKAV